MNDGDGVVTRGRFFRGATRLPIRIEVWELSRVHEGENSLEEFCYFLSGKGMTDVGEAATRDVPTGG